MASGILFSIFRLTDRLAAPLRRSLISSSDDPSAINDELSQLKSTLSTINAVLRDAERKEIQDASVKLWLSELKGVAYDAEDVLDELDYELLRSTLEPPPTRKRKQPDDDRISQSSFRARIRVKIREIKNRFDEIAHDRSALQLREEDGPPRPQRMPTRPPTSSFLEQSDVYGREEDTQKLTDLLLSSDGHGKGSNASVIPVVGMGGVGKTTLAQLVYNDEKVRRHFDARGWVCVSESFDLSRTVKAMAESLAGIPCSLTELAAIQESVRDELQDKRFLIVLDDVWNEDRNLWECLMSTLASDVVEGSKIVVTTRSEKVARIVQTMPFYHLNCLSDEACWLLFRRWALTEPDDDDAAVANLAEIGKKLAIKCRGLPLAAKALGGLLRYEGDEENWVDILESDLWDVDEAGSEILPALKLSYQHLPMHLKRCFVYCSLFPKDFLFKRDQLVRLWMVEGYIRPEDAGGEYFDDLLWRSFFQFSQLHSEKFVMHHLHHDLARYISGEECSVLEDSDISSVSKAGRHASLIPNNPRGTMHLRTAGEPRALRSLLLIYGPALLYSLTDPVMLDSALVKVKISEDVFLNLECLRTLDLSYTDVRELPDSIGGLKHLRYLGLRNTRVRKLPESVCRLYFLQVLDMEKCCSLVELPKGIGNLVNLQHLHLPTVEQSFVCMPSGIGRLSGLQELMAFNVGGDVRHCRIGELKDMVHLRGNLHVSGLRNVARGWDAREANLKNMKNLQHLILDWNVHQSDYKCSHQENVNLDCSSSISKLSAPWEHFEDEGVVLEELKPHPNLTVLDIMKYRSLRFSNWVGDPAFTKLVTVRLSDCDKSEALPPLGRLPSLKNLYLIGLSSLRRIGPDFCGTKGFPALKTLEFDCLPELEEWLGVEDCALPCLDMLMIHGCNKLRSLPNLLAPSLSELDVGGCKQLTVLPAPPSLTSLCMDGAFQDCIWSYTEDLTALQYLEVRFCETLTCLPLHNLHVLRTLLITGCSQLESLHCVGSFSTAPVASSSSTMAMPQVGLHNLASLEQLSLANCPLLQLAAEEQLPLTLKLVEINNCETMMEWCNGEVGGTQLARIPRIMVDLDVYEHGDDDQDVYQFFYK